MIDGGFSMSRAADMVTRLGHATGLPLREGAQLRPPDPDEHVDAWFTHAAEELGLEAQITVLDAAAREDLHRTRVPFAICSKEDNNLLLVTRVSRRYLTISQSDGTQRRISAAQLFADADGARVAAGDLFRELKLTDAERSKLNRALARATNHGEKRLILWSLRLPGSAPLVDQWNEAHLTSLIAFFGAASLLETAAFLGAWVAIGQGALRGSFDRGWALEWVLLLLSQVAFRTMAATWQADISTRIGVIARRRMLAATLEFEPDRVRGEGIGGLLAKIFELEALDEFTFSTLFALALGTVEWLLVGGLVLAALDSRLALLVWLSFSLALGLTTRFFVRLRNAWTGLRLRLTGELVDQMLGHRTRAVQGSMSTDHRDQDLLRSYEPVSKSLDQVKIVLASIPQIWLAVGLLAAAPGYIRGTVSTDVLAATLGALLLGQRSLTRLARGLHGLGAALASFSQVRDQLSMPAGERSVARLPAVSHVPSPVEAREVSFAYRPTGTPVLHHCSLRIEPGDRVLLEGPSGGGKSTLAAVLAGLRAPQSGLVLSGGLDRSAIGDAAWRGRVGYTPQFHDNHIFASTFLFNLLLAREWPPTAAAMQQAEELCHALGLGELLERMPAGMLQTIGDTGWQLSHGEKSRVYLARALLQQADLTILDESFAAMDPETLRRCLEVVIERSHSLLVIAHP